jgi:hypothetical protein
MFESALEAESRYAVGEPVNIRFTLTNCTADTVFVLAWYTPLEGILGEFLRVDCDGEEVPYRGILAKRGDPASDEYITLPGGGAVSAEVDIATAYDMSHPGRYRVAYTPLLCDVTAQADLVPRHRDDHRSTELPTVVAAFEMFCGSDDTQT